MAGGKKDAEEGPIIHTPHTHVRTLRKRGHYQRRR